MKYRKKPVIIDALKFDGSPAGAVAVLDWMPDCPFKFVPNYDLRVGVLEIATLEGTMTARAGDFIIRGVKGEFYPCKPDLFAATYEAVTEETPND